MNVPNDCFDDRCKYTNSICVQCSAFEWSCGTKTRHDVLNDV